MLSLENIRNKDSNLLGVKVKNFGECGFCQDDGNKEILNIPWSIFSQWLYISQCMGSKEWGAVFWFKDGAITSFKIPKQQVGSTECEFSEDLGGEGIVHSHHDMGAFHSSQDDHHARNLYVYSIVISSSGCTATKRVKLPCKGFGYVKVELRITGLPDIDLGKISGKAFLSSASREEAQQQPGFKHAQLPCDNCLQHDCQNCGYYGLVQAPCEHCSSFKCKECNLTRGMDLSGVLPFCDLCEDYGFCSECHKLFQYLENYPQDKKRFEHLLANKI